MREIIVGLERNSPHAERVGAAVSLVNSSQRYFFLRFREDVEINQPEGLPIKGDVIAAEISRGYAGVKMIYVTDQPFDDNWFSREYRHCAVITTFDWEQRFAPPSLRAYLVYQFAQALLLMEADIDEQMLLRGLVHEPPIGCLHDLNVDKGHIKYGMIAGSMCFKCEGALRQYGVRPEVINAIHRILAIVRDEVIGKSRLVHPDSAFVIMRFTENDENANAYWQGLRPGLKDVGLKPHRADDQVQPAQILDQVLQYIKRSRFVVAKVDEHNLNVYFELGLAMGLDKDVLLVSEAGLVMNLPVDLRNWECLTYDRGNYQQLQERVASFFQQNYHLQRRQD